MRNVLKKILLPLFLLSTVVSVGFSAWNIDDPKFEFNVTRRTDLQKVAYLASDTNTYYASIEKAVAAANSKGNSQKVYVIPGTTYTITESFAINSGVSLIFPYEDTSYTQTGTDATKIEYSGGTTSDANHFAKEDERTTLITLSENTTITLKAGSVFRIGGVTGCNAQNYSGQTTGKYTELKMEAGSSIVCNGGTLDVCGGYITESVINEGGKIFINSGTLNVPFVIYDFKGGSITLGLINSNKVCPFSIFDFVNIQVYTEIQKGSYFYGKAKIAMSDKFVYTTVNIINPGNEKNSLFILKDEGSIAFKYEKINDERFPAAKQSNASDILPNDQNYTTFFISGGCSFGEITISITYNGIPKTINSANFFLPFSYKMRVFVNSGANVTINAKLKFMPGSSVTIEEGANVNIQAPVVFYDGEFKDVQTYAAYPSGKPSAQVEVGGNLTVDANGSFGSVMENGSVGAPVIAISDNATLSYQSTVLSATTYEGNGNNPSGIQALYSSSGTIEIKRYAACYNVSKDGTGSTLLNGNQKVLSSKPIYNVVTINGTKYWKLSFSNYTVNFLSHDGTTSVHTSLTNIDTGRVTLPNATEVSNLLGWSIKKFAKEEEKTFDPGYSAYLYDIHSYFPEDKVLNLYAVLDTTMAKLSVSVSYAEDYKNKDTPKYSINDTPYEGARTFENVFYVGDTITYKPTSNVNSTSFGDGFDVTSNNGVYTLKIKREQCTIAITASGNNGCFVEGTLVTMSDGTKLPVEQLKEGDAVKVFDHSTGKLTTSIIARDTHNDEQAIQTDVMNLKFSDGTISRIVGDHGYFSKEDNKYVYIDANNYEEYLGKEFVIFDDNGDVDYVTLDDVKITNENVRIFAPITYKHLNLIADDLLTISGGLEGIFNYFDLDENMMIDRDRMNEDIERYGLYTYEEWAEYLTPVQFDAFNVKYLKVSVGKGLVTKERLIKYIRMYL